MSDDTDAGGCGCSTEDTTSWRIHQQSLAKFADRSSTEAANAISNSVNQQFAQGVALLELVTGRAAPSVQSNSDQLNSKLVELLGSINSKLDAALAK